MLDSNNLFCQDRNGDKLWEYTSRENFDNVSVISPTIQNDQTSRFLYEKYKGNCHTEYSDEIIDGVVKRQLEKIDNKEDTSYLIVLDDFLGQTSKMGHNAISIVNVEEA